MWYSYAGEFYSALRKVETINILGKKMGLGVLKDSELAQIKKCKQHIFSLICGYVV